MLESGVADGTIKFTNKGDVPLVASIYKRAFIDELSAAKELTYSGLGWGDEALATLLQALVFAEAQGALGNLEQLDLSRNQIGDLGITDFSRQFPIRSLCALTYLDLSSNQIGDVGMIEFSRSIPIGSMGALQELYLHYNQIGDLGMIEFSRSIAIGSLVNLKTLNLWDNTIGDEGMKAFALAIASGSLPSLELLGVDDGPL
jgi:Leucine-rich repeat (LRR) protein